MKKITGLMLLPVLLLTGCSRNLPETVYKRDGISFVSPQGWKIINERRIKDTGYHVTCQRKDFGSSGIFMVSWLNGTIKLDQYIRLYRNEFEKNVLMKAATVHFQEPVDSVFNDIPCSMSTYQAKILGVESRGEILSFHCGGRTFMLVFQESVDESKKIRLGFERIKSSFSCNAGKGNSEA
jgi:hypothetical protein